MKTYLCSRTMAESPDQTVTIVRTDAVEFMRALKGQKGAGIFVMGGGELARSFFEADLIDEVALNTHPVLLGSGIPLFLGMSRQINLHLLECRTLESGCALLRYEVIH